MSFETGAHVLQRNIELGRVRFVVPSIVVADTTDETRLFRRAGTAIKAARCFALRADPAAYEAEAQRELLAGAWDYVDATWETTDALVVARAGDRYSAWLLWWAGSDEFLGWYVNFEQPWTRTKLGFDSTDLAVDLIVDPDRHCEWKDRDAFNRRIDLGLITAADAVEVQSAMSTVVRAIEATEGIFSDELVHWRPDPTWPTPQLPRNWNDVPTRP